jgi:hypothetical protein
MWAYEQSCGVVLPLLCLVIVYLWTLLPDTTLKQLWRQSASAVSVGSSPFFEAEAENVAFWLQPGPGILLNASINRGGGSGATGECRYAPIAAILTGGLGNNLFIAAFGIALSLQRAGTAAGLALVRTEVSDLRGPEVRKLERTLFERFHFVDSPGEWFDELQKKALANNYSAAARPPSQNLGTYDWRNWCRIVAPEAEQWATAPCGTEQVLTGFFQEAALFRNEAVLLRRIFAVPTTVASKFRGMFPPPGFRHSTNGVLDDYVAATISHDTSVGPRGGVPWAIHVRRGDYVQKADWHHLLPLSYFAEGIVRMLEYLEASNAAGGPVFVFSDDIEWVRSQDVFRNLEGAIFVTERDPLRAFYFLALVAEGGVICSNSSFCWWAAFLSELQRRKFFKRLVVFADGWTAAHSLSGFHGPEDCGVILRTEYMTVLDGFR